MFGRTLQRGVAAITSIPPHSSVMGKCGGLGVPGVTGQQAGIKSKQADGPIPFRSELSIEQQIWLGRNRQPRVLLDLAVQLARSPAGITQCQQAVARS